MYISSMYVYVPLMTTDASCDASMSFHAVTRAVTSMAGLGANNTYAAENRGVRRNREGRRRERE